MKKFSVYIYIWNFFSVYIYTRSFNFSLFFLGYFRWRDLIKSIPNGLIPLYFPEDNSKNQLNSINPKYDPKTYPAARMARFVNRTTITHPLNKINDSMNIVKYKINNDDALHYINENKVFFSSLQKIRFSFQKTV